MSRRVAAAFIRLGTRQVVAVWGEGAMPVAIMTGGQRQRREVVVVDVVLLVAVAVVVVARGWPAGSMAMLRMCTSGRLVTWRW